MPQDQTKAEPFRHPRKERLYQEDVEGLDLGTMPGVYPYTRDFMRMATP